MAQDSSPVPEATSARTRAFPDLRQSGISVTGGVIASLIQLGILLSMAALIFAGPLAPFISDGVGLLLVGTGIMSVVFALLSSRPGLLIFGQDGPALVVALIAAQVAGAIPAVHSAAVYSTAIAALALTTLATGLTFLLLGSFRLGALVRYLPYPVVGGFLAGTGWLLVLGGIGVMTGRQPGLADLPGLFAPALLGQWLPGLLFGLLILLVLQRWQHPLALPGLFALGIALFFAWLAATGRSLNDARSNGWLLGPFPDRPAWAPLNPATFADIHWPSIIAQSGTIGAAVAISVFGLLLNVSSLQVARREELDLNQELRAAGWAQLAAGVVSGVPGYHALGASVLVHRMGVHSRLAGITMGLCIAAAFFFGTSLIALVPQVVLGGLVCYLGLGFLHEWLVAARGRLPRLDYALVLLILLLIAVFGLLTGVIVGLLIAVVMFVVAYSRVDVIKHALTGATVQSRVTRSVAEQERLRELGLQAEIFQLQGFLFFGTAHELLERVRQRVQTQELPPLRFALFDFRLASRLDSTALLSFAKLRQLAEQRGFCLIFTGLNPEIEGQIRQIMPLGERPGLVQLFPDLDRGLEWCENRLLAENPVAEAAPQTLREQLARLAPAATGIDSLIDHLEHRTVEAGSYLMRQGDAPEDMFFIEAGQVTAQIVQPGGATVRLETMRGGRAVGELGFYLGRRRTADVVVDEPSSVYRVSRAGLALLIERDPAAAAAFHQIMARLLSDRVVHLIDTVDALQR